jgi:hypothetical protein
VDRGVQEGAFGESVVRAEHAQPLRLAAVVGPGDLDLALDDDEAGFALRASRKEGSARRKPALGGRVCEEVHNGPIETCEELAAAEKRTVIFHDGSLAP